MLKSAFLTACRAHHLSPKTQRSYWSAASRYIEWTKAKTLNDLKHNASDNFKTYLSELAQKESVSRSAQSLALFSVRFLVESVAGGSVGEIRTIPKVNGRRKIVEVPNDSECLKITSSDNVNGLALRLIYGTACRLCDVLRLRIRDLDFDKKLISIHLSKGGKSRLVPLPISLIKELKALIGKRDESEYLFKSATSDDHLSEMTIQREIARARAKHGIKKNYTVHTLRHAAAQWMERQGVQKSTIQVVLGHAHSSTTDTYLVSGVKSVANVPTPI